ncbi:MAG: potassium-transporting ATPase subunit KdpA [Candidatus Omnitrophota bacterium]
MDLLDFSQILLYAVCLIAATPILGSFMAKVFEGEKNFLSPVFGPLEKLTYRFAGIDPKEEMGWKRYSVALLLFNAMGFLAVYLLQIFQKTLPLNPQGLSNVRWDLAFNTAVSFMTNTNWQAYCGESSLGYLVQMLGLTVQNFLSAATGIGVMLALIRGLTRKSTNGLGNFWVDLTRSTLYVLVPLSLLWALLLAGQGVVQNFTPYLKATTLEGSEQIIPLGPAASQIAIKQLGTNGGGFFGVNSAHPFENPTPFSNFLEMFAILLIPAAQVYMFGVMIKKKRQGLALLAAMSIIFALALGVALKAELIPNPVFGTSSAMEGKETRFGITNSILWATATTSASNGSVNAMHDSLSPLAGLIAMLNMMLGEVVFGGAGAGFYGILMHVILTVFIAGLMVGRTPEYLGKKIEGPEICWAIAAVLIPNAVILGGAALANMLPWGTSSVSNAGPHGLSQILYAFSSATGNNGSAFAGLNVNTVFYNVTLGMAMLIGRFVVIIPALAIAGNLAGKKTSPVSAGTFPTDGGLFVLLLVSVILIVGALTFLPVLTLGPISEHFLMLQGRAF